MYIVIGLKVIFLYGNVSIHLNQLTVICTTRGAIYNNQFLVPEGMCGSNEIGYFLQNDAYFDETTPLMLVTLRA